MTEEKKAMKENKDKKIANKSKEIQKKTKKIQNKAKETEKKAKKAKVTKGAAKKVLNRFPEKRYKLLAGVIGYPINTSAPALTRASVINLDPSTNACIMEYLYDNYLVNWQR